MIKLLTLLGFVLTASQTASALLIADIASMAVRDFSSSEVGNAMNSTVTANNETLGWEFTPQRKIVVESLGIYDHILGAGEGFETSHTVGIWDSTGTNLLASVNFAAGDSGTLASPLVNDAKGIFRFLPITPVNLDANVEYVIGANFPNGDRVFHTGGSVVVSDDLFPHPVSASRRWSNTLGFTFPSSGGQFDETGFFGPNFTFSIAEPSTIALMALGLAGLGYRTRGRMFSC